MMSLEEPIVRFRQIEKTYDGVTRVVDNLNLDIEKGSFLSLLGPSGSGKTTSLMMLAGFEQPTAGEIFLRGKSLRNVPPHKRGMGIVFQNYALFPHMSVARNVAYPLQQRGVSKEDIRQRVEKALGMVELHGVGNRLPMQLSGGQQQRVALARALVFEPELVLMDEPLGALDKQLREQMQIEIKHLHERLGITVVYVTHDQSEALAMSSKIAVFHRGRIQQIATANEIYEHPQTSFVANFIGENNRLDGEVEAVQANECRVRLLDGSFVVAKAISARSPGAPTSLSIRPERVIFHPDETVNNVFQSRIQELIYFGDHVLVRMHVCGIKDFVAKIPIGSITSSIEKGKTLPIGWRTEHCRALDLLS